MENVGIDLGKLHSHVVVVSEHGVITRSKVRTPDLRKLLGTYPKSRVVMEACTQSRAVAQAAIRAGHEAVVVPGAYVRMLGVGARGIKTDDRDAEALANASMMNRTLPSSHLRSETSRQRQELLAARDTVLDARRNAALRIKSWLAGHLVSVTGRANTVEFVRAVRRVAEIEKIQISFAIEQLLRFYETSCAQLDVFDEEIERIVKNDPVCVRLMQMPGVGPQIVLSLTSQVDDPKRFKNAEHLASYLALVPGEATTGGKLRRTGTIVAGPRALKAKLVQGAWAMWKSRPNDPLVLWARTIAAKRGKRIAVMALARKIATILWSMWKHGTPYNPALASTVREPPPSSATTAVKSVKQRPRLVVEPESADTTAKSKTAKSETATPTKTVKSKTAKPTKTARAVKATASSSRGSA